MIKQTIQPLFDNVLVKPLAAEEKLPSGIILPDSAKEKPDPCAYPASETSTIS